jgi:hypothetical protein
MSVDWFARGVAIGGLGAACASLGWQVYAWSSQRRVRFEVQIDADGLRQNPGDDDGYPVVAIRNRSDRAISVELIALESPEAELLVRDSPPLADQSWDSRGFRHIGELPTHLEPGESGKWSIEILSRTSERPKDVTVIVTASGQTEKRPLWIQGRPATV